MLPQTLGWPPVVHCVLITFSQKLIERLEGKAIVIPLVGDHVSTLGGKDFELGLWRCSQVLGEKGLYMLPLILAFAGDLFIYSCFPPVSPAPNS